MPLGIGIFAGMSTRFFGFYSLAACVAAAVSQSKKAVSAVAAAVVGIGLLTAPIDSAHGQTGTPEVTDFCIVLNEASDYELRYGWVTCVPQLSTLGSPVEWILGQVYARHREDVSSDGSTAYGYYLFYPRDFNTQEIIRDGRFILVSYYITGGSSSLFPMAWAWVEDSDGNEYTIDVQLLYSP